MKVAPLFHAGRHCDTNLSDIFFRELGIPPPTRLGAQAARYLFRLTAQMVKKR
jgi:hypothetical protein